MSLNHQNFAISTFPIIHFVCVFLAPQPRKQFCISIVFIFYAKLFACVREYETRRQSVLWEMWKWRITVFKSKKKNIPIRVDGALVLFSMKVRDFGTQKWPQYTSLWFVLKTCKQRT